MRKRVRADSGARPVSREPAQALDAPDPEPASGPAPHTFLSPSVKEYLELGMAIPGEFDSAGNGFLPSRYYLSVLSNGFLYPPTFVLVGDRTRKEQNIYLFHKKIYVIFFKSKTQLEHNAMLCSRGMWGCAQNPISYLQGRI